MKVNQLVGSVKNESYKDVCAFHKFENSQDTHMTENGLVKSFKKVCSGWFKHWNFSGKSNKNRKIFHLNRS